MKLHLPPKRRFLKAATIKSYQFWMYLLFSYLSSLSWICIVKDAGAENYAGGKCAVQTYEWATMWAFEYHHRPRAATPCEYICLFSTWMYLFLSIWMYLFPPCEYICVFVGGIPASLSHIPGSQPLGYPTICGHVRICRLFATAAAQDNSNQLGQRSSRLCN